MKRTVLVIAALLLAGSYATSSKPGLAHDLSLSGGGYGFGLIERVGWGDNGQGGGYGGTPRARVAAIAAVAMAAASSPTGWRLRRRQQ